MATQSSTPLWLDLKIDYIDENFEKVFDYIYANNIKGKDGFYEITMGLFNDRIEALIKEFHDKPLLQDELLLNNKERARFIARLLGLYLLAADAKSENYRIALLLFVYTLTILEPKSINLDMTENLLKFVFGELPEKSILEWSDIEDFYPAIVAYKVNSAMSKARGAAPSDIYKEMGILNLKSKKLQLQAAQYGMAEQFTSSLSIIKECINIVGPKSERLKQTDSSDIDCILEFTNNFIATQQRSQSTRKRYRVGENVDVKVTGKSGGHIYVASTDSNYETIKGRLDFPNNFFFYKESDFFEALKTGDEFEAEYCGEGIFTLFKPFAGYVKDELYPQYEEVRAQAVFIDHNRIGWGTENGFGVYTNIIDNIEVGDCALIRLTNMAQINGEPTGWIFGEYIETIEATEEQIDYDDAKRFTISECYTYETSNNTTNAPVLSAELIKALYRVLIFNQQYCVANPTDRYKIISVCRMLATLVNQEEDVQYIGFLADYLQALVHFAKGKHDEIEIPKFALSHDEDCIERRKSIIQILQAYESTENAELLDTIIDQNSDILLVKLATLVQSCNRLKEVINPAMQNVIKREIVSSLAVETEGETDLEEENGIYLGIENDRQEFKTSFFHAPQSAKEQRQEINIFRGVCAFLNTTEGGTLYLGVNDLGYVQGIDAEIAYLQKITYGNYKGIDGYMRYITDRAKAYFDIDVVVNIKTRPMYDNNVVALEIAPYEYGIVKLENQAYLRVNGESVAINEAAIQRMEQRKKSSKIKRDTKIESLSKAIHNKLCVVLHNYQSSNSGKIGDRLVEVFDFTDNSASIWCYDLEKSDIRLFNIARIGSVEITQTPWSNQDKHKCGNIDIFNMTGNERISICLRMNLRAKNLLIEEYPLAKEHISKEDNNSWLLSTEVYNIAGVARFYIGLAGSIEIVNAPELVTYVREYRRAHLDKI